VDPAGIQKKRKGFVGPPQHDIVAIGHLEKISPFQCFCGHEKVANLAAKLELLISTIDDIT
jgi:hypothetical protein